jgi:16S rRNA (cytosine967-C5)-methyltransferase
MSAEPVRSAGAPASSSRAIALAALLACQRSDLALDELIQQKVTPATVDPRDRALAMELTYGVLRRQETIDWRLSAVLTKPLARLPAVIQMLLRMGAYQLLFLDRVPPSAAVNETVTLAKAYAKKLGRDWSGLVNAVLRNLLRLPAPSWPEPGLHPAEFLSVRYAVPQWLSARWVERLGFEQAEAACRATSAVPGVTLRVNRRRLTREDFLERLRQEGIAARPTAISSVGVALDKGQLVDSLPGFRTGDFYVEDEAAQLIAPLLDPQPGQAVLDACAAPGGKATHLAELMDNRGHIVAMDRQQERLKLLQDNCRRLGVSIVQPVAGDARTPIEVLGNATAPVAFDRVLLDAPCSGLGVLRRHPEAKWKKHTGMLRRHRQLQLDILIGVSAVLRPGGVLVYSTCSTEWEETEEVVGGFCDAHPEWTREPVAPWLPSTALPFVTAHGALSTMGNECGMDGFYAARLRKKA